MIYLKKDVSAVVRVGPFVDATNGVTPETGITLSGADQAEVLKQGSGGVVSISSNTWTAITSCDGWYNLTLSATDTDTMGALYVIVQDESVCLPVFMHCTVLHPNVWDSLIGGTEFLEVTGLKPDWSIASTMLTVLERDDATTQFTKTITTSASADPVTGLA